MEFVGDVSARVELAVGKPADGPWARMTPQ
jgi:hypothetical protein